MVTLSERAAQKVRELLEAEGDPSLTSLRVAVEGGGCSGFQYALGFDSGARRRRRDLEIVTACGWSSTAPACRT